ncbi:hypothetical protein NEOLI_001689 [Neolecta irregularis DAH-3]|uniref:Hypervirulence associated protein TUDOR domain-containing protein n=1 Tax=Neolecta irregularis (strain DAH-3) TaxID=1198029 RepID=A0A1U7LGP8_NEOID|nr:hypothetical protein NEOLI_001689 [Neolecta irregularis DAH-3]|eukprot:OLL21722.1 hypothetical protein NEOLI_001689 [Neolecta irregularis DAH-3]
MVNEKPAVVDNVSWNRENGEPSGTVAEVKGHGKLDIKTKGKLAHKNDDPENPAVHAKRSGNDTVKRASDHVELGNRHADKKKSKETDISTGEKRQSKAEANGDNKKAKTHDSDKKHSSGKNTKKETQAKQADSKVEDAGESKDGEKQIAKKASEPKTTLKKQPKASAKRKSRTPALGQISSRTRSQAK